MSRTKAAPAPDAAPQEVVRTIKGFDRNLQCRGFQFEIGAIYTHDGAVRACEAGFHACEYPLDVFGYYGPGTSRYAEVTQSGAISRHNEDTKVASAKITIEAEIGIPKIVERAIAWVLGQTKPADSKHSEGYQSASSATGDQSASSVTGYQSASSATGDRSASSATGYQSASSATGDQSASSATGYQSASSATGDQSASSATGDQSASSVTGDRSASSVTGYRSASSATGYRSASSATGYRSASSVHGEQSCAMACGHEGRAMAEKDGNALFLVYRDPDSSGIQHAWAGITGRDGIKAGVWYSLNSDGAPVAVVS